MLEQHANAAPPGRLVQGRGPVVEPVTVSHVRLARPSLAKISRSLAHRSFGAPRAGGCPPATDEATRRRPIERGWGGRGWHAAGRVGRASTCRPRCAAPRRSSGWGCRRRRTAAPRAAAPPPLRGAPGSRGEGGQDAAWPAALPAEHHRLPRVVERGAWRKGAATQWMVRHGADHPQSVISGPLTACP